MMPTSPDERIEFAMRMRDEADGYIRIAHEYGDTIIFDLRDAPAIFEDMAKFAGLTGEVRPYQLLDRFANLIDPTCKVESMELRDERDEATPYTLTLSCGHKMGAESYGDIPRYCPRCGARVVSGDDE